MTASLAVGLLGLLVLACEDETSGLDVSFPTLDGGFDSELRIYGEALADVDRASIEDALKAKYVP